MRPSAFEIGQTGQPRLLSVTSTPASTQSIDSNSNEQASPETPATTAGMPHKSGDVHTNKADPTLQATDADPSTAPLGKEGLNATVNGMLDLVSEAGGTYLK